MGDVADNKYLFVHRQSRLGRPEIGLRFHRGDENIDMTVLISHEDARELRRLAELKTPAFGIKLRSVAFTLISGIPSSARQNEATAAYRQLFCDLTSL